MLILSIPNGRGQIDLSEIWTQTVNTDEMTYIARCDIDPKTPRFSAGINILFTIGAKPEILWEREVSYIEPSA